MYEKQYLNVNYSVGNKLKIGSSFIARSNRTRFLLLVIFINFAQILQLVLEHEGRIANRFLENNLC